MCINNLGHMTKLAAMPIYGKNPSKIFSGTGLPILAKLGLKHQVLQCINHDPVMTTYFTERSTCIRMGKTIKMPFDAKNLQEIGK